MSDDYTTTPNFGLYKPTPNADYDLWGDHLNANADKLDTVISAIAAAGNVLLNQINADAYGVVSDYQVLPGTVSWSGTTVTVAGANFSVATGPNNPYLIMPAGGDDGHGNSVPAIVRVISASGTTATVDTAAAHPFSGLAATFGGPGLNPDNITITSPGTTDVRAGDVLTAVGGDAIRPGTFYVSQTKVVSATVVAAGSGGAPGPVYLRGTTGHGRRVILLGTVQSDGTLASTLTVYDAGAYWQNIAALEATTPTTTEPMSAAPFATTVPGSWSAGGSVITISGLVHPTVLPYIHVGASVIAQADAGVGITAQSVVTAIDGTGRIVTISPAAVSAGTGQDVTFTDNLRPVSFAATFAASATTITATAALPASVTVGQAIYGAGLQGIGDPTNPNSTYIAAIDGTRTIITISVATTGATVAPVTIASVPYLQGVTVNLNFGAAVVAYKDWGAYRTLPGAGFSTTSVHADGTASTATVALTAAGSETSGVNFVHCGTDNRAALNAWLAAVRAAYTPYSNAGIEAVLPPGCYLTLGSVDATNICGGRGLNFKLAGAVIHSAIPATATGSAAYAWNAIGARFYRMEGQLFIRGNNWFPPDVGFIMGRITATQACDNMAMYDIQVSGHFRFAARMLGNVESSTAINCEGSNARPPLNALTPIYGTVFDGQNHWGKFPFTTDLGVTFKGITDINPIAICSGGGVPFLFNSTGWMYTLHGYAASWAMPTIFMGAAGAPYLDIHCETQALADALFIWHPSNPSSDFTGKFIDSSLNASNSLFSFDTEGRYGVPITAFSAEDATIEINPQVRSTELFDYAPALTAINWRGDIYVGSTGYTAATHYHNQANFVGRLMLGNTSTSYWSKNLTAKTIVATDQVVAVNNIQSQDGNVIASLGFLVADGPGSLPFYANLGRGSLSLGTVGAPGTPGVVAPSVVFHGPGNTSATRTHQIIENTAGTLDIFGSGASNAYVRVNGTLAVTQPIVLPPGSTGAFLPLTGGLHSIAESGAVGDGVTDDQPAIQAWLNTLTAGAEVLLQPGKWYYIHATSLTIPPHVVIRGAYNARDNQLATAGTFTAAGGFYIDPTLPIGIIMSASSALKSVKVYRAGMASGVNAATAAADYATWATEAVYRKTSAAVAISASPTVIPLTDTSGITVGMPVTGPGGYSPTGTAWAMFVTVTAVSPGVSVTVSRGPIIAIVSGAFLRFGNSLGVMVSRGCSGIVLDDVQIIGFRTGIQTHPGQFSITRGFGDCITNIECMDGGDYAVINDCEWLPLYGNPTPNVRPGDAVFVHDCGGPIFKGCFNFGWQTGWHVENSSPKFHACGAEVPTDANATTENWTIRGGSQTELYHCHAQAAAIGFHFDGASHFYATGCTSSGNLTTLANNVAHFLFENTGVGLMYGTVVSPFAFAGYPNKVPFKYGTGTINALAIHNPVIEDLATTPTAPFIQGNAPFTTTPTLAQGIVYQGARPNGGTSTILPYWNGIILDSGLNPIPTFTINMPAYPADCQVTEIWFNVGVTAITFGTTDGSAVGNWSAAAPAGSRQRWIYSAAQNKWFPGGAGAFMPLSGGTVTGATTFSAAGTALTVTNNTSLGGPVVLAANAGNFMTVTGGVASTNAINIQQSGTGGFAFGAGTASISAGAATFAGTVASAGANILQAGNATGTNNVIRFTPTAAGGVPSITTIGVDTNVQLDIICQGTGGIRLRSPVGFNNTTPIAKPTVSGAKGSNAALASLMTALAAYGLVVDSTTA